MFPEGDAWVDEHFFMLHWRRTFWLDLEGYPRGLVVALWTRTGCYRYGVNFIVLLHAGPGGVNHPGSKTLHLDRFSLESRQPEPPVRFFHILDVLVLRRYRRGHVHGHTLASTITRPPYYRIPGCGRESVSHTEYQPNQLTT